MSTGYGLCPLDLLLIDEEEVIRLNEVDLSFPNPCPPSRAPTVQDIRAALESWPGCDYTERLCFAGRELEFCVNAPDVGDGMSRPRRMKSRRAAFASTTAPTRFWSRSRNVSPGCAVTENGGEVIIVTAGTAPEAEWISLF